MRLSRQAKALLPALEEACRTSNDNEGIGRFYHVPIYDVLIVRLAMAEANEEPAPRISIAEKASTALKEATNKAIFKWGSRHGINADQARVLLMDRRMP